MNTMFFMSKTLSVLSKKEEVAMGKIFFKCIVFLLTVLFLCSMQSGPDIYAADEKTGSGDIKKMEETIKKQEERIKQLQSEINKQQGGGEKASGQKQPLDKQVMAEQALRESWGCCGTESRVVKIHDGVVSVYFNNIHDIISFFDSGAEGHARADHAVFLKATGLERGTIEYYSAERRLYAISGSLAEAKTAQY